MRPRRRLADIIQDSTCHKGRLLHYLPSQPGHSSKQRWRGQHTDFCSLTGMPQLLQVCECRQKGATRSTAGDLEVCSCFALTILLPLVCAGQAWPLAPQEFPLMCLLA